MSRFNLIGTIELNGLDKKNPWKKSLSGDNPGLNVGLISVAAKNNRIWTEAVGFKQDTIKVTDQDDNELNVEWKDRNNPDIIKKVKSFKKHQIILDKDHNKTFIADLDFVNYIADNIDLIEGKTVQLTGQIQKNIYNGSVSDRFQVQSLYVKDDSDEDLKKRFRITTVFYWNKDGMDTADWRKDKKLTIFGYTLDYDKTKKGATGANKMTYFPQTMIFDCGKIDFDDEEQVKKVRFRLRQLGLDYVDGELKNKLKKNTWYKNEVVVAYSNGQEEIEFTIDQLSPTQKEAVELGIKTVEDFRPYGSIYGQRVSTWKIVDFPLMGKFVDGIQEEEDDIEDNIFVFTEEEDLDEVMNKPEDPDEDEDEKEEQKDEEAHAKEKKAPPEIDDEDMFA